jgi:uncharacterized glyoxalase superfamily protein PhnB
MAQIIPTFRYEDAPAAIAFLKDAFGFTEHQISERDGVIHHAELKLGDAYIMLGQVREEGADVNQRGPSTTYVTTDDPDGLFARATAAGAEVVRGLVDQDYGSREFAVKDPAGNVWSFGTYVPG